MPLANLIRKRGLMVEMIQQEVCSMSQPVVLRNRANGTSPELSNRFGDADKSVFEVV